jgi:hypothetical protein
MVGRGTRRVPFVRTFLEDSMPYVMVPVPEEHVVDVMQYVTRLIVEASREEWDPDAVEELFLEADEGARSLLSVVASAALSGKELAAGDAVKKLELRMRDLAELLAPLEAAARQANRRPLFEMQPGERQGPGGRKVKVHNIVMKRDVAEMVRTAELKAREVEPHPLDRDVG